MLVNFELKGTSEKIGFIGTCVICELKGIVLKLEFGGLCMSMKLNLRYLCEI